MRLFDLDIDVLHFRFIRGCTAIPRHKDWFYGRYTLTQILKYVHISDILLIAEIKLKCGR